MQQANLADALAIVLMIAVKDDAAYERAANAAVARPASERPGVSLQIGRRVLGVA